MPLSLNLSTTEQLEISSLEDLSESILEGLCVNTLSSKYISACTYSEIAYLYDDLISSQSSAADYTSDALITLVDITEVQPLVDLLIPFYTVSKQQTAILSANTPYMVLAQVMNNHVLRISPFDSIDEFLEADNQTVPQSWADLSAAIGFPISSGNISD